MKRSFFCKTICAVFIFSFFYLSAFCQAQRAPAYPLITHNTYFSVWSFTDALNTSTTRHWTGANQALNGLIKVDDITYNFMGTSAVSPYKTILPATDEADYNCQYLFDEPAAGWETSAYNDKSWNTGAAPFGNDTAKCKTAWTTQDIWVRRTFNMDSTTVNKLVLKLYHDDNVQVYLNGTKVYSVTGWNNDLQYFPITNYLTVGENVIAIHCRNTKFGAGLDFGLADQVKVDQQQAIKTAIQKSVTVTATQTKYVFTCGKADLHVTFNSPLLMSDLDLFSRPVSYITFDVNSNDNSNHDVKIYLGASSDLARNNTSQVVAASKYNTGSVSILKAGTVQQPVLLKQQEIIDWGYMYVAVPNVFKSTQYISQTTSASNPFYDKDTLSLITDGKLQVLSTIIPFGSVGATAVKKFIEIGYDDLYPIQLFNTNLQPWWKTHNNQTIEKVLGKAAYEYTGIQQRCALFDDSLFSNAVQSGDSNYAKLCVLAYRQSIAAHQLVKSPLSNDLLFLSKENSSGGFMSTVDVSYPAIPMYLVYNPELAKGMLNGIFYYCESGKWTKTFAPHDLGGYPFGNGQTYFFDMPVEETGNMILMAAAIAKAEGNTNYVKLHWPLLTQWVNYLKETGYNPPFQYTSDDFAGPIAHSVNLSVKSINAIGAYAGLALEMGDTATFTTYYTIARRWAAQWLAKGNGGDHYLLAFDQPGTWSQKYNMVWDKILGLQLFPQSAYNKEVQYYLTKQNTYGLPLDNRKTYTKSDWLLWSAVLANKDADFKTLVAPVYKYAMETGSRVPISDFHETTTGLQYQFQARSVVGGYFMKMLQKKFEALPSPALASAAALTANATIAETKKLNIKISPNPANTYSSVTIENAVGKVYITVLDMNGKSVQAKTITGSGNGAVTLAGLPKGSYIVQVKDDNTVTTTTLLIAK